MQCATESGPHPARELHEVIFSLVFFKYLFNDIVECDFIRLNISLLMTLFLFCFTAPAPARSELILLKL